MTICLIEGLTMLWSCSDDRDSYPVPNDIENLKVTPAPGQATLNWTSPTNENLYYVQIKYTIGATGKSYKKQVSQYANELVIDNLLQKYGEISFTVQAFSRGNTAGTIHQITAQAEEASLTFGTPAKIDLDYKKIQTNASFPTRSIKDLVDRNVATFFHSQWSSLVEIPHYLVVDLDERVSTVKFCSANTNRTNDSSWRTINLCTSDDYNPTEWFDSVEKIDDNTVDISQAGIHKETTLTELPDGVSEVYDSEVIPLSKPSRYLWFEMTGATKGAPYLVLGELEICRCSMVVLE